MGLKYKSRSFPEFIKSVFPLVFIMAGFLSCATSEIAFVPDYYTSEINPTNTTETKPGWPGLYTGIIPAADGPGIDVQLTLNNNSTFVLQYRYIDRGDSVYNVRGTFTWDETGEIAILDIINTPPYYKLEGNRLIQLDMQGNRITGNLADHYVLEKK